MDLVMDDKKKLLNLQLFNNVIVYPYDIIYWFIGIYNHIIK
jgi:hypothetical protein